MSDGSNPRTDIGVALFLIVVCAVVLWETRSIPPGSFEPLGSAPIPQAVAGVIILLALTVIARAWWALRRIDGEHPPAATTPRAFDAAVVLGLTVLYVLAMAARLFDFAIVTTVFLVIAIGFLIRFERRLLPYAVAIALLMGYGCQYLFTRVFVVDLPGL